MNVNASIKQNVLSSDVGKDHRISGTRSIALECSPGQIKIPKNMSVTELFVKVAASKHVDLVLERSQAKGVSGAWQIALSPVAPFCSFEVKREHALRLD